MTSHDNIPAAKTRWGLLVTTLILGFVLVGMGVVSFYGARIASNAVIRSRGVDMTIAVRRALVLSQGDIESALQETVDEIDGLTYAAVVTHRLGVLAKAGTPASSVEPSGLRPELLIIPSFDGLL